MAFGRLFLLYSLPLLASSVIGFRDRRDTNLQLGLSMQRFNDVGAYSCIGVRLGRVTGEML